jgi:predicted O-linked N-acetylglucosamine transferase (SPINDLY family)
MTPFSDDQLLERGMACHEAGQFAQAEVIYRQILAENPRDADVLQLLGLTCLQMGRADEALSLLDRAVQLNDSAPDGRCSRGTILIALNRHAEAAVEFLRALDLKPDYFEAAWRLGDALFAAGQFDGSLAAFRRGVELCHTAGEIHANLGNLLKDAGQIAEAVQHLRRAVELLPQNSAVHSNLAMALLYDPAATPADILRELKSWDEKHARPIANPGVKFELDKDPKRKLRIGYVSPDFRDHVVGRNLLPLFRNHDRGQFEIFCYSNSRQSDAITGEFRSYADQSREIDSEDDESVAEMIRRDKIDILIDLAGHTAGNRLLVFARKPAPIQATFGGYPGGTGLSAMDYRISDSFLDPVELTEHHYVEKVARLADSFWCYDPNLMASGAPLPGPAPSSRNGFVTFGCLNNSCKINETTLNLWSRVLAAIPTARLILRAPFPSFRAQILAQLNVTAGRVEFISHQTRQDYLKTYQRIDIGLDAIPYNGHTTSLDALCMGVPVITLIGQTSVGRAGWSQLCNLNLRDLAALSEEEFVRKSVELAEDQTRLGELRSQLREKMLASPLTDGKRFAVNMEQVFRKMWTNT